VKEKWNQSTGDDLDGRPDQLEGKIQQRSGLAVVELSSVEFTGARAQPGLLVGTRR
jgi:hypothetical protein